MSRWHHMPCPKCDSSDALSYKDGDEWGHCFSCGKDSPLNPDSFKPREEIDMQEVYEDVDSIKEFPVRGFKERGITKTVAEFYGVRVGYGNDGEIISHYYPYTKSNEVCAYKERKLPKAFSVHGDFKDTQLFGQSLFSGGRKLTITEGELDCLSMAQAQYEKTGKFYAVVSLASASQTKTLLEQREWIRSFDEVILMFDQDDAGKVALDKAARIIGFDKVKVANLPEKDASDVLTKRGSEELLRCFWNAAPYSPAGIVRGEEVWQQFKRLKETVSVAYPNCLEGLNEKLHGMRQGEIVLFTSGTGSGKSTVIKEIVLDILEKTKDMVGMVSLEESIGDTAQKFIGMQLNKNLSMVDTTEEEERKAWQEVFGDERLILLDHQGSVGDESLVDKIEYLALMGCKYIILDHITIAVSEGMGGKTGNEAVDAFMSDLLKVTKKHNVWLGVISHLRKGEKKVFEEGDLPSVDDIKGSGSIKQISFDIIAFARNMTAESIQERNTIKFRVLKSRFTGQTGDCGSTTYDPNTGRLKALDVFDFQ